MSIDTRRAVEEIRRITFRLMKEVGGGHYGGNLSELEILTVLYCDIMKTDPDNPNWYDRDRLVLSKGHGGFGLYAVLAYKGFISFNEIVKGDEHGIMMPKHASTKVPGVDISMGSLGQGLSVAVGMALAAKSDSKNIKVFVLLGDGECNEGQIWEAAMTASKYKLDNLIAIIDNNHLAFDGRTEDIMPLSPLNEKWRSFGWNAIEADGHNVEDLYNAFKEAEKQNDKPSIIIADTVKGKGISYMENSVAWHAGTVTEEQYQKGMIELGGENK